MLLVFLFISLFIIVIGAIWFTSVYFSQNLDKNALAAQKAEICVVDTQNNEIDNGKIYRYIPYSDISVNIINAFVALEDKRFFDHNGIDYYRTAGAFVKNLQSGKIKQGGSTITQQLAKNTQLTSEQTVSRKIKEMRLARQIEKNYSKEEILELYLNAIYYGNGIYGIDSACRNYFGKKPSEISPAEGAILAGIVKNPTRYSPEENKDLSEQRKNLVLRLMAEQGYITRSEYETALAYRFTPPTTEPGVFSPYFAAALQESARILGISEKELICSPYVIETYCDEYKQNVLYNATLSDRLKCKNKYEKSASRASLLAENETGGISAFYSDVPFDIFAVRRSPASCAKPILVYAPALEKGIITTQTPLADVPIDIHGYKPKNYEKTYSGWITAEEAVKRSTNTVAVSLLEKTGLEQSKEIATKCGFVFNESDADYALALGGMTYGLTLPELTEAYMTLACGGMHKNVAFVKRILGEDGTVLYKNDMRSSRALSSDAAYLTTSMLVSAVRDGTSRKLNGFSYDIAAKTGTNAGGRNDELNSDAWSLSYTPENTLCVWYGDLIGDKTTGVETTGSNYPSLLAAYIYKNIHEPKVTTFSRPDSVIETEIDSYALQTDRVIMRAHPHTPKTCRKTALFSTANCPEEYSPYFEIDKVSFSFIEENDKKRIQIEASSPYRYKLIEKNLLSRETKEFPVENGDILPKNALQDHGIYSYYLALYYQDEFLGYTSDKLSFIGL